ncbi:anti-sigma factor [Pseudoalteromonas agarivorans]|uniref:Anti-sigma factor n=1 Tax=Pseudoalteromonas agarivorans TaxID=176102 RepID=A0ABR5VT22_9GAMM|nr:cupin domain-containing protein [Pseudoalteromonas telluritireducens]KYL33888.1 anti-sigma factor [Pseudoalteromonas telluritireducens]
MRVNSDFSQHALMLPTQYRWQTSPQAGVERVMLDRIGAEKARATSVVRYAPESTFPSHAHPGGEEILVLSGTFSDESGDYPQGFYLRNPPGSSHAPKSKSGATIFVKLWQMCVTETAPVRINTDDPATWITQNNRIICPLYKNDNEVTKLVKLAPQQPLFDNLKAHNALELFILGGSVVHNEVEYSKGSWLRLPCNNKAVISAGNNSAKIYLKVGNFNNIGCGG